MRTPLTTVIFFLAQIIHFLNNLQQQIPHKKLLEQNQKYAKLMMSQLALLQSFVEDLLDLRQLKDGVLSLTAELFDPNEILEEIVDTFIPQAKAQRVSLRIQPRTELRMPEEMYPHI